MDDRARALADIAALARQHDLSASDIVAVLGEPDATAKDARGRGVLMRVLGFMGGTFVFAGVAVFISLRWDTMNSAARVIITLGSGLAAFALAALASRDERFDKAATPLFLMAAALEPVGLLVAFDEFGSGGEWQWAALITCATVGLQFAAAFASLRLSTLLFLCLFFGALFWSTALDLLDVDGEGVALVVGISLVLAAVGIDRTRHAVITPAWYLVGACGVLYGVFDILEGTPVEIGFLMVAAGFVYLSVALHSRTLLFVATLAILGYTAWFTGEHFADSVGWPVALIVLGLCLIGLSALAFRIDRDYLRAPQPTSRDA